MNRRIFLQLPFVAALARLFGVGKAEAQCTTVTPAAPTSVRPGDAFLLPDGHEFVPNGGDLYFYEDGKLVGGGTAVMDADDFVWRDLRGDGPMEPMLIYEDDGVSPPRLVYSFPVRTVPPEVMRALCAQEFPLPLGYTTVETEDGPRLRAPDGTLFVVA